MIWGDSTLFSNSAVQQLIDHDTRTTFYSEVANPLSSLISRSTGELFICCNAGNTFEPEMLDQFYAWYQKIPDADLYYSDNDEIIPRTLEKTPFFKPGNYSPELHLSINYLSRSFIKKSSALMRINRVCEDLVLLS